jgi:hypothetical protein
VNIGFPPQSYPRASAAKADLTKMAQRTELHRYVFFMSPEFPTAQRLPRFERDGVQVWSVTV